MYGDYSHWDFGDWLFVIANGCCGAGIAYIVCGGMLELNETTALHWAIGIFILHFAVCRIITWNFK